METKNLENNEAEKNTLSRKEVSSFQKNQKKNSTFKMAAAF